MKDMVSQIVNYPQASRLWVVHFMDLRFRLCGWCGWEVGLYREVTES